MEGLCRKLTEREYLNFLLRRCGFDELDGIDDF